MPKDSPKRIEFDVPEGFALPGGSEAKDGEFDVVCTFKVKDGGKKLCLSVLGETPMPGYKDEDKEEEAPTKDTRPDYKAMGEMAANMMGQAAAPQEAEAA